MSTTLISVGRVGLSLPPLLQLPSYSNISSLKNPKKVHGPSRIRSRLIPMKPSRVSRQEDRRPLKASPGHRSPSSSHYQAPSSALPMMYKHATKDKSEPPATQTTSRTSRDARPTERGFREGLQGFASSFSRTLGYRGAAQDSGASTGVTANVVSKPPVSSRHDRHHPDHAGVSVQKIRQEGATLKDLRDYFATHIPALSDFELRKTVGTGTFGRVRVVRLREGPTYLQTVPMALKILRKSKIIQMKQVEHVKSEKAILQAINHPFIVNLCASFQDEKRLFMLMEYVNGGELFSHLRREQRLPNEHAKFYAAEIVLAFDYLHDLRIVYRDLKPENLLLDGQGHIKLTDFGFAKVVDDRTWTLCGTPEYLAPEIIQSKGHGKSVDWWALGILIFEMLVGAPPFYDENPMNIYKKVLEGNVEFPEYLESKAKDLIRKLLTQDRTKRYGCLKYGAEDVKRHKWFRGIDWQECFDRKIRAPFIPGVKGPDDTSMFDSYPESSESDSTVLTAKEQEWFHDF
eukprot:Blabericola_migrator_1__5842@NODE_295_length_10235_cov_141_552026_g242_i0_p4_GENE_NODE_295_length_10235_cov_141_552026_g242_i0NODE_295_length_10235_cov_141_552026_g242_i0_p4_ORF_typecomplete_len516_score54_36Pkinase/PF00069_25/4_2e75Pkinase_Tyr/PF07714_17/1_3e44Kinaselike/PF14531_6/2_5e17Kdo/PF06293_14/2_9e07Pkinase_fungal/PF17667_1/6_6e07WaaY/PF06176_11/6_9e07APH/PF01636_23/2_6e05RIO1/PF01163_22/8_8e05YrbLPhoP_reg/PF10707_9/0_076YukC/PF10140_9/0_077ActFrag_cataly/PF09192_10/0_12FTA2/PF13095_6/2